MVRPNGGTIITTELSWLTLAIISLVSFRLTRLVTTDTLTEGLRRRVWARWPTEDTVFPDDGSVTIDPDSVAYGTTSRGVEVYWSDTDRAWAPISPTLGGYLISCDWCASIWVSAIVTVVAGWGLGWGWRMGIGIWLAVSTVVGLVSEWTD